MMASLEPFIALRGAIFWRVDQPRDELWRRLDEGIGPDFCAASACLSLCSRWLADSRSDHSQNARCGL